MLSSLAGMPLSDLGLAATQDACVAAGDEPARAVASVRAGWAAGRATGGSATG